MHSEFINNPSIEEDREHLTVPSIFAEADNLGTSAPGLASEPTRFYSHFQDCMEMYAPAQKVTAYLDAHQNWFSHCAHPMKVEPIGKNGYALVIGRFGSFGYELEPRIGLELLPQENGIYRIRTIPVPNYTAQGYEVDFQASQTFVEVPAREYFHKQECDTLQGPEAITLVEWNLDLSVGLRFPKFIHKLPQSLIQSTGDRLLRQIVRQVSRRLTYKVQENFHTTMGIPMHKKLKKWGAKAKS